MAVPKILRGTYVSLLLGGGGGPEVFAPICGLTTRSFTAQTNTSDTFIRDCADPEDIPVRRVTATGEQWDLSGSGLLDRNALATVQAAKGVTKNWRFLLGQPTTDVVTNGGGYYAGPAMLTNLQITGSDEDYVSVELTIVSDGEWVFTVLP